MLRATISTEVNLHVTCMLQIIAGVTNSSNRGKVEIYSHRHSISDCSLFTIPCHIPKVNKAILTAVLGHTQISLCAASVLVHVLNDYSIK